MSELRIVSAQEWRQRAEQAESALAELRGECVVLWEAVEFYANRSNWEYDGPETTRPGYGYDGTEINGPANDEGERARQVLTAIRMSAALGALCEAALKRREVRLALANWRGDPTRRPREYVELGHTLREAEKIEDAAADAVLAAMGKEGASQ